MHTADLWENMVETPSGCWEWQGRRSKDYGRVRCLGGDWLVPRLIWTLTFGPITDGLCVLHKCDNPPCCNPTHLFLGTNLDNIADRGAKGRTARGFTPWWLVQGARSPRAKLTDAQITAIRSDPRSLSKLGKEYGVTKQAIARVKRLPVGVSTGLK